MSCKRRILRKVILFRPTMSPSVPLVSYNTALGRQKWQIRTDFTTLQLYNTNLKSNSEDYNYKQAEVLIYLDFL